MKKILIIGLLSCSLTALADPHGAHYEGWSNEQRAYSHHEQAEYNNRNWSTYQWNAWRTPQPQVYYQPQPQRYYQPGSTYQYYAPPPPQYYYGNGGAISITVPGFSLYLGN